MTLGFDTMSAVTITRSSWERPGQRVGEHSTSPPVRLDLLDLAVIHHVGRMLSWPTTTPTQWAANLQDVSIRANGHSVPYSWGYWRDGQEIEMRGLDYRNAANNVAGDNGATNARSVSMLMIVPDDHEPTAEQIAAVNRRLATLPPVTIVGHRDLEPTACPGAGNYRALTDRLIRQDPTDMPPDIFIARAPANRPGNPPWFLCTATSAVYAHGHDLAGIREVRLTDERYDLLHESVIGRPWRR